MNLKIKIICPFCNEIDKRGGLRTYMKITDIIEFVIPDLGADEVDILTECKKCTNEIRLKVSGT